jgi:hypothetical protein
MSSLDNNSKRDPPFQHYMSSFVLRVPKSWKILDNSSTKATGKTETGSSERNMIQGESSRFEHCLSQIENKKCKANHNIPLFTKWISVNQQLDYDRLPINKTTRSKSVDCIDIPFSSPKTAIPIRSSSMPTFLNCKEEKNTERKIIMPGGLRKRALTFHQMDFIDQSRHNFGDEISYSKKNSNFIESKYQNLIQYNDIRRKRSIKSAKAAGSETDKIQMGNEASVQNRALMLEAAQVLLDLTHS